MFSPRSKKYSLSRAEPGFTVTYIFINIVQSWIEKILVGFRKEEFKPQATSDMLLKNLFIKPVNLQSAKCGYYSGSAKFEYADKHFCKFDFLY